MFNFFSADRISTTRHIFLDYYSAAPRMLNLLLEKSEIYTWWYFFAFIVDIKLVQYWFLLSFLLLYKSHNKSVFWNSRGTIIWKLIHITADTFLFLDLLIQDTRSHEAAQTWTTSLFTTAFSKLGLPRKSYEQRSRSFRYDSRIDIHKQNLSFFT